MRPLTAASARWTLFATIVGSSLVFIDGSVVGLALPMLQRTLQATAADTQWIVEGYALALGALMLFGGALGDRFGRKRIFIIGVAIFAASSLACALAPTIGILIAARVVQGIGGMLLAPGSLALIGARFAGKERDRAFASWSAYGALTSSIGPALGGLIIDHFGWRIVFLVNVPLAALVLWAAIAHIDESRDEDLRGPIDVAGALAVTVGLGVLTYAFISSTEYGWSAPRVVVALVFSAISLAAFLPLEKRAVAPIMPLSLFSSRTFSGVNGVTFLLYGALGGIFYFLPFDMIQVHGYSATAAAVATLPLILCMVFLARAGTAVMRALGPRFSLCAGPAAIALGFLLLGALESNGTYWSTFFPGLLCVGVGLGFTVAPLTATVMDAADPHLLGSASGVNNAVSRIAGLLAIAALGAVLWASFNANLNARLAVIQATPAQRATVDRERARLGGATLSDARLHGAVIGAFRNGFTIVAFTCAALTLAAAIAALASIESRKEAATP